MSKSKCKYMHNVFRFFKTLKKLKTVIEYRIVRSCQLTNNPAQIALFLQCILHQVMFPRSSRNFLQKTCAEHAMPMNREMWLISYFRVWEKSIQISLNFLGGNHRVLWRPISVNKIETNPKVEMKEMRHFLSFSSCVKYICNFFIVSSRL